MEMGMGLTNVKSDGQSHAVGRDGTVRLRAAISLRRWTLDPGPAMARAFDLEGKRKPDSPGRRKPEFADPRRLKVPALAETGCPGRPRSIDGLRRCGRFSQQIEEPPDPGIHHGSLHRDGIEPESRQRQWRFDAHDAESRRMHVDEPPRQR